MSKKMLNFDYKAIKLFLEQKNCYFYPINNSNYRIINTKQQKFEFNTSKNTLTCLKSNTITEIHDFKQLFDLINQ